MPSSTDLVIYHNPRCSKSRAALELLEAHATTSGSSLQVIDYQKMPLNLAQIKALHKKLGVSVGDMLRDGEEEYRALGLESADDAKRLAALVAHPKLLQRPIVEYKGRAIIARPPEILKDWLAR